MKTTSFMLLVVLICAGAWAYTTHPKAFKDFIADFSESNNPAPEIQSTPSTATNSVAATPVTAPVVTPPPAATTNALSEQPAQGQTLQVEKTFVAPDPLPKQDNWTWTTSDGKIYSNVVITKVEADCVTVLDSDGGARIDIALLPADIQKQLNYDPDLAKIAAEKRAQELAQSRQAMDAENRMLAEKLQSTNQQTSQNVQSDTAKVNNLQAAAIKNKIAAYQADMAQNQQQADQASALFNAPGNMYYNNGHQEYHYSDGSGPYKQAVQDDQQQIATLQSQLTALNSSH